MVEELRRNIAKKEKVGINIFYSSKIEINEKLSNILWGIEEEEIPYILVPSDENDANILGYEASKESKLGVGIGISETEVVMPRLKTDILELFAATSTGRLAEAAFELDERYCTTVMLVAGGYPGSYEKGNVITGLENVKDSIVFHAGTKLADGQVLTNGGRVMAVSSYGTTMEEALALSYKNVEHLKFKDMNFRRDIGQDLLKLVR